MSDDLIKRSDALSAAGDMSYIAFEIRKKLRMIPSAEPMPDYIYNVLVVRHYCNGMVAMNEECYKRMQSVDPVTTEEAIEHLQECGWLPEHDRILTEPKSGKWVYGTDEDGNEDAYPWTCSICGEKYPWCPNYCPHCGARMKGADDE